MKKIVVLLLISVMIMSNSIIGIASDESYEPILSVNKTMQLSVDAKACILMDANTGTVLMAYNENEKLFPASVTKIMTLLLVVEAIEAGKLTLDMEITKPMTRVRHYVRDRRNY